MGPYCLGEYGVDGILTINAVALNGPAFDIPLLKPLLMEFAIRGENLLLPQAAGRAALPRRLDEASHTLSIWVNGSVNQAGTPYTTAQLLDGTGLTTNLDFLWTNVFAPVTVAPWTRAASWLLPNGTTRTAAVQLSPLRAVGDWDFREQLFQFTLTIPDGRFV